MLRQVEVRKEYMPDLVERLKRQRLRYQAFGAGLTRLVSACFPDVGITKREARERASALSDFRLTLTDLLVGDIDEEIAGIESKSYTAFATAETLVELTKSRDQYQAQIDAMESQLEAFAKFPDEMHPAFQMMKGLIESQVIPYRKTVQDIEEQISAVQAQLEAAESASASSSRAKRKIKA